jgi:hypothetical protein
MNVTVKRCPHAGKRVNQTPESDIPEEVKQAAIEAKKTERSRRNGRALAVWGTILIGLPFVLPLVFFVNGALTNYPLPFVMYPYLVLVFYLFADVGGLILYIGSRNASYLRKPIGWTALATALLPMVAAVLFQDYLLRFDGTNLNRPVSFVVLIALLLTLLCMLALCVFAVLLLIRVFPKQSKPEPEA